MLCLTCVQSRWEVLRFKKANHTQRTNTSNVISTDLVTSGSSIEYATRLAKILARKTNAPVYVGCSMNLAGMTMEEEMEGLTAIVHVFTEHWKSRR